MTKKTPLACVILTAGQGKRMQSSLKKVLHPLAGRMMIHWLLRSVEELSPDKVIVVTAPDADDVVAAVSPHQCVVQHNPRGTGDAVKAALPLLQGFTGDVLILLGDMPLLSSGMMQELVRTRHYDDRTALSVLGVEYQNPPAFGRLILKQDKTLEKIVEDRDATPQERAIRLCNTGAFCVAGDKLGEWLERLDSNNAQGEFYITDLPQIAAEDGFISRVSILHDSDEVLGVNSRADLAVVEAAVQNTLRKKAMENGATLTDPQSVFFSYDTVLGRDVEIGPNVVFGTGVVVADNVRILPFCHLEGARIDSGCSVGPFARLRPGTHLKTKTKIGNFVEIKNATLHEGVKAGHLSYIGDADIGAGTNFSCGAITANYDGFDKHKTTIGANAMIGSNVNLVAPVTIGAGAYIAAGSTVTKDVEGDALAVSRADMRVLKGWARKNRATKE